MDYNLKLGFEYMGYDVKFDINAHGDSWFVEIDGQVREFDDPPRAMKHIDKVLAFKHLIGTEVIAFNHRYNTREKITITGTFYHDVDDGAPMGLFLMDQNSKRVGNDCFFLKEEDIPLLEEYLVMEKQREDIDAKSFELYKKIKDKDLISKAQDMMVW